MTNMKNKTICITGGHITPALAVISEIQKTYPTWDMFVIGRDIAIEGSREISVERRLVEQKKLRFLPLTAGRLSRTLGITNIVSFLKIPVGFVQAIGYVRRYKPDLVVSFGGYIALPVVLASALFGIPIITHEQTRVAGLANKIIGWFARKICITFEDTVAQFPAKKTVVTGLPMREELFMPPSQPSFNVPSGPIVYITGGSTGAVSMNDRLFPLLGELVQKYVVIHQTGKLSVSKAKDIKNALPDTLQDRYIPKDFLESSDIAWILRKAHVVVGRSGANTVMEIAILGKYMICIPLPWSAGGEQLENAKWLSTLGLGIVIKQNDVAKETLAKALDSIGVKGKAPTVVIPNDGAARVMAQISAILL
jgi:UDP-N-acetylglucosamine--N-acetylmuramyl-(pentapeptide) pyrophosphoryl-undecaprenol N-acetylglucosamine transferase